MSLIQKRKAKKLLKHEKNAKNKVVSKVKKEAKKPAKKIIVEGLHSTIPSVRRKAQKMVKHLASVQDSQKQQAQNDTAQALMSGDADITQLELVSYEVATMALDQHKEVLHSIKSVQEKADFKAKILPSYLAFVEEYIESGANYPNEILTTVMVWLFDAMQFKKALEYAAYAVDQKQPSPFKSNIQTIAARFIDEWAIDQYKSEQSAEPYLGMVVSLIYSGEWPDVFIGIQSDIYKQYARYAELKKDLSTAKSFYEKAVEVNPEGHGVKTALAKVNKALETTT